MYRERLVATPVPTPSARRLQEVLLAYHDFRQLKASHPLLDNTFDLAQWQAQRLKNTHSDLYADPGYHAGLEFLLTDLYAPSSMTRRDDNIDRVFPKMVKWLPDNLLDTFAGLVELNLLTQRLDLEMVDVLNRRGEAIDSLSESRYCEVVRASGRADERSKQISLMADTGRQLDRYVRNRTLGWVLSISRGPADMADLTDLHSFLHRGYSAFRAMDNVEALIDRLVARESQVLENILNHHPKPFQLPETL
ncbi:hypothetical protein [Marinobacter sp. CHS3-4]|uniref:FFLEELY motif protein n=1 Tax=Marinobacter sp. CHS3-4 TaxID=3045174 RepID=UPI0024B5CBB8|nr:hypothetical protein [Marinobacter sp. CHS3-4]MDI9244332.1 hypothetical protein [Marinobacter sp. CHS3-4]